MKYSIIMKDIDEMVSDLLSSERGYIDIPMAGRFLNRLETIMRLAKENEQDSLYLLAAGVNTLIEKIVLESVEQSAGYEILEQGVKMMHEAGTACMRSETYDGDIGSLLESISSITGICFSGQYVLESPAEVEEEDTDKKDMAIDAMIVEEGLLRDFVVEALEYLGEIEVNILNLEEDPHDKGYINAVFRPFHSIKGVAGFLNLKDISCLSHDLENILDRARSGELSVNSTLIDLILDGADALKSIIGSYQEILEGKRKKPARIDLTEITERINALDRSIYEGGRVKKLGEILLEDGVISREHLEESLQNADGIPHRKLGEKLITEGKATPRQVSKALRKQARQIADTSTIRVDVKKLDDLVDMIGELVICQSMMKQHRVIMESQNGKLIRDIARLTSITSDLQRTSTSLRMVTIKQTFQRMARLVRDLAKSGGKKVSIDLVGEETEIDRKMVEEIYNPLVHMVRNAVDHGIENPECRIKNGKSDTGLIRLKAFHQGGNVVIEISDDGGGLKRAQILKKAMERGIVTNPELLTEQDIYQLIFKPGFSTSAEVTDVSGRGVGMDVVKKGVEKLRGKIEIASVEGEGTTLTAFFPLTLAIVDGMIVRVGKERYIIPATMVRQLLRPSRAAYNNVVGKGEMLNVTGELLPLVRLYQVFNVDSDFKEPWDALTVVVESGKKAKCLFVDEVLGKEEVVVKGLGEGLKNTRGISGGAILGDGNIGLILDPEGLFEMSTYH